MDVSVRDRGVYVFGPYRLDPVRRTLARDTTPLKLAARLFDTLLYLIEAQGRVVEKDELLAAIWQGRIVEEGNLTQTIFSLRKILQADGCEDGYIVTTPGRGYRFAAPVRTEYASPGPAARSLPVVPDHVAPATGSAPARVPWWRRRVAVLAVAALLCVGTAIEISHLRRHSGNGVNAAAFAPPPHSVAVLAFTNMSGDASQDYFSDGLAEELIDTLGLIAPIHVAARVSAFSFKGKDATITDIARALNVGTVLEGSVRRNGPRVRIAVQLIDGRTGYQTWSQTFDRDQGDILQLQGDIARAVTASLHVQLAGDDVAKLAQGGTANPLALDAYLRGRALKDGGDQSSATAQAALAEFDKAVALDPGYALAHTWRARTICDLSIFGTYSDPAVARAKVTEALQAADKAIALAPQLGVAHAIRAYVLANGMLDFVQADASLTRALKLAPDDPLVLTTYAYQEVDYGRFDAALAAEQRAASEDPLNPRSYDNLAVVQYVTRHYDDALANLGHEEALRGQSTIRIVAYMSMSQIMKGNAAAAQRICAAGHGWTSNLCLAIALRALDKPDEAKAALATLHATMGDGGAYQYAQVYAQWGDTAQAVQWLQTAYRLRDPGLVSLKVDPVLDPVRNAQGYKDIERQLNFPQ